MGLPWPSPDSRGIPAAHPLRNTCARPPVGGMATASPERYLRCCPGSCAGTRSWDARPAAGVGWAAKPNVTGSHAVPARHPTRPPAASGTATPGKARARCRADCPAVGKFWVSAPGRVTFSLPTQRESDQRESVPRHPGLPAARPDFPRFGAAPEAGIDGPSLAQLCLARPSMAAYPLRNTCARPSVRGMRTELPERCLGQHLVDKATPLSTLRERSNRRVDGRSRSPITLVRSGWHCIPTRSMGVISAKRSGDANRPLCPAEWNRRGEG